MCARGTDSSVERERAKSNTPKLVTASSGIGVFWFDNHPRGPVLEYFRCRLEQTLVAPSRVFDDISRLAERRVANEKQSRCGPPSGFR